MDADHPMTGGWCNSRNDRHVEVKLGQEAWEAERSVHSNGVLQLLCCVSWESDPSLPGNKTERVEDQPGLMGQDAINPESQQATWGSLHPDPPLGQMGKLRSRAIEPRLESFQDFFWP
jgi:hypothetical protein